jgi:hypothetical protein
MLATQDERFRVIELLHCNVSQTPPKIYFQTIWGCEASSAALQAILSLCKVRLLHSDTTGASIPTLKVLMISRSLETSYQKS